MQGIMALPEMNGAQPSGRNAFSDPKAAALFNQLRQEVPPAEFSNSLLDAAAQADPQAVAEFRQELQGLELSIGDLEILNQMVNEILANPRDYAAIRARYLEEGMPEELLPEQFDPAFFAALNLALDQLTPTQAPQGFAGGGIASLAQYGRNGDTMLAHITPQEAALLRARGGSGTINPVTGLPEFFLKKIGKAFKSIGNAVKKFAKSTVGKIITTVALGFFLGPAAASFLGVSSAAGVAAVSGFIGSAGSTLLAGGNIKDALKAGAVGGLTAGAGAGIMGGADAFASGSYTGPTTVGGQFERVQDFFTPRAVAPISQANPSIVNSPALPSPTEAAAVPAPVEAAALPTTTGAAAPVTPQGGMAAAEATGYLRPSDAAPAPIQTALSRPPTTPGLMESMRNLDYEGVYKNISPSAIREQGMVDAIAKAKTVMQLPADAPVTADVLKVADRFAPGVLSTYGPLAATGLGIAALAGGFKTEPAQRPNIIPPDTGEDLIRKNPDLYRLNFGGVRTATSGYNPYAMMYQPYQPPKMAKGGTAEFPRKTGPINGPGTGTSDSIPAMLSDGEFVFTAKAVRAAGGGSRRVGAKRMYALMKMLEKKNVHN